MPNTDAPAWFDDSPVVVKQRKKRAKIVREDDVEGKYVAAREAEGKLVLKVKVLGRPGYPDRWVLGSAADAVSQLTMSLQGGLTQFSSEREIERVALAVVESMFSMAELKKQANSRFQPKQKQIIPMLRKRGFKVDIVHG